MSVLSRVCGIQLPRGRTVLSLSNIKMSKIKKKTLVVFKRLPWSTLLPEAMLVSMVHDAAWGVKGVERYGAGSGRGGGG